MTSFRLTLRLASAFLLLGIGLASGKGERDFANEWAALHGGEVEKRLPDGDRADILSDSHAIEVEFAPKWKEAIGQSLSYSLQTNKRAGIVLIVRTTKERLFLIRLNSLILYYRLPIDVWSIGPASDAAPE